VNILFFLSTKAQLTASFESNMSQERNQEVNRGIKKKKQKNNHMLKLDEQSARSLKEMTLQGVLPNSS